MKQITNLFQSILFVMVVLDGCERQCSGLRKIQKNTCEMVTTCFDTRNKCSTVFLDWIPMGRNLLVNDMGCQVDCPPLLHKCPQVSKGRLLCKLLKPLQTWHGIESYPTEIIISGQAYRCETWSKFI